MILERVKCYFFLGELLEKDKESFVEEQYKNIINLEKSNPK